MSVLFSSEPLGCARTYSLISAGIIVGQTMPDDREVVDGSVSLFNSP